MGNAESEPETKEQDRPPPPPPAAARRGATTTPLEPAAPTTPPPLLTPPPIKKAKLSLLKSLKDVREPLSQEKTIEAIARRRGLLQRAPGPPRDVVGVGVVRHDDDEDRRRFDY